jgi:hypothetical protein
MTQQAPGSAQPSCLQMAMETVPCTWREFPRLMGVSSIWYRFPRTAWTWAYCASEWMPSTRRCGSRAYLCMRTDQGQAG